ncbi:DUF2637 domain-containing protein [Isoptericola haloaureus]|uniref:DUF2637 domain-containing protein n=1 Tax=Isoptericola haloaureus TaxID=1542902 RepID=A0ABU7Z895_9MICO
MSSNRINPDSRPVLILTVALTLTVALVSFVLSFAALRDAAVWGNVPPALTWAVPVIIDLSVLVYTAAALVLRTRAESARLSLSLVGLFSIVSVAGNAAHGLELNEQHQHWIGVVLVALAPVSVLTSVHTLASLVVVEPHVAAEAHATPLPGLSDHDRELLGNLASTHPNSKRTTDTLAAILTMRREGAKLKELSTATGMSVTLVKTALADLRQAGLLAAPARLASYQH